MEKLGCGQDHRLPIKTSVRDLPYLRDPAVLLNDQLKSPQDVGKAMSILVIGGNLSGAAAPIVTGYVIEATGSYDWAFGIAGFFLIAGSVIALTMTRNTVDLSEPSDGRRDTKGMASLPTGL